MNTKLVIGRLGQDGQLKYLNNGKAVMEISVADTYKTKDRETTSWWRVTLWGKTAERFAPYCKKGVEIMAYGREEQRDYQNKDGQKVTTSTLHADIFRVAAQTQSPEGQQNEWTEETIPY